MLYCYGALLTEIPWQWIKNDINVVSACIESESGCWLLVYHVTKTQVMLDLAMDVRHVYPVASKTIS